MTTLVALPLWLVVLGALFAAWALLDRLLVPSVRWVIRRRVGRVIDELNDRLQLQIPALHLTKREVLIDRLLFDGEVMKAVDERAAETGAPRQAVMAEVERYAREIVPSFNAYAYFRIGYYLARRCAEFLYRVRLGYADDKALAAIPPNASVVFVMNHRSNMDYVLVAYLAASRSALSYAVGEWARIWPLQGLIRSLGAYFVRRNSGSPLYRQVLARYVHMATQGGVVQAVYPEGGLSKDGLLRAPKLGLIAYMVTAFDPKGERDLVFVPVGINYDRVLEDRSLLKSLDREAPKRGATFALSTTFRFAFHNFALMARRRWYRFGYACVNFGAPLSMREYLARTGVAFGGDKDTRFAAVETLGRELMDRIATVVPVLPVSLVAAIFGEDPAREIDALQLKGRAHELIAALEKKGAHVYIPRTDRDYAITVGLRMLTLRHLVLEREGLFRINPGEEPVVRYYANAIAHLLPPVAA